MPTTAVRTGVSVLTRHGGAGTRSALDTLNLHRHWRHPRTHTLHDPAAWKVQHLGRHVVDDTPPPDHGQL